jgi:aminoglycoside 6'-N-acetyltransferase
MALLTFIGSTTWAEKPALRQGAAGAALSLHPFTPVDIGLLEQWLAQPHLARFWLNGPGDRAARLERHRSRFIEAMEIDWLAPFIIRLGPEAAMPDADPQRIGALLLRHVNVMPYWRSHGLSRETIGIDLFIGEASLTGQGLGRRAIQLAVQAAFSDQEVTALMADPDPRNQAAIAAFRQAGFAEAGDAVTPAGAVRLLKRGRAAGPG